MKLIDLFNSNALKVPWPTCVDGAKVQAHRQEPVFCSKHCLNKSCLGGKGTRLGVHCHVGFTYFQVQMAGQTLVCYGALSANGSNPISAKIRHDFKDDLRGRTLTAVQFQEWVDTIVNLMKLLDDERAQITSKALEPLHETPKLTKDILNIANALIQKQPGKTFEEKLDAAPLEVKSIMKTAEFLLDSLDMLSIFFNPATAGTGALIRCEPYKLLDKLSKVIGRQYVPGAYAKVRILLEGASYRAYDVYDSLKVIPLTILDNAMKYSFGDVVTIKVLDEPLGTRVEVCSIGPYIPEDERNRIFERSERGKFAAAVHRQGMGVGLFVAAAAAKANGTKVEVRSAGRGYEQNGIPVADNSFSFVVRDAPKK